MIDAPTEEWVCQYWPVDKPIPEGWRDAGRMVGHHSAYRFIEPVGGAWGALDADPPAAGAPEHVYVHVTPAGRLVSYVGGQAMAADMDAVNLARIIAEASEALRLKLANGQG